MSYKGNNYSIDKDITSKQKSYISGILLDIYTGIYLILLIIENKNSDF